MIYYSVEGDTGVNSQTSPVPLPQKWISSGPNPTKKLGGNPVPLLEEWLPLPCWGFIFDNFFAQICQLQ